MRLSLPRKLSESEIDEMLAALRQGEELHIDRRFSEEPSKLTMVVEEDAVRLEDRLGIDESQALQLVTQLSSDPIPDDFLVRLRASGPVTVRMAGGDYVVPKLQLVRKQDSTDELVLSERRYLDESGIRTMLEEWIVDMARPLRPEEVEECFKDLRNGLGLTVTPEAEAAHELIYRNGVLTMTVQGAQPPRELSDSELRAWLEGGKFLSITTWISRY